MAQENKGQQRLDAIYNQAVKTNLFDGSQDEFVSRIQSDPAYLGDVKNLFTDYRRQNGIEEEAPSDERFMSFMGLEPQKKNETGSEESSAPGSAGADVYAPVIQSAAEFRQGLKENTGEVEDQEHPAFEAGYNKDEIAAALSSLGEIEKQITDRRATGSIGVSAGAQNAESAELSALEGEKKRREKEYLRQRQDAISQWEKDQYEGPARERYGETGPGIVDEGKDKGSNLLQVQVAVSRFDEELGNTDEQSVVPYLNNALGDLGFEFDEAYWGVDGYRVVYPDGYVPEGRDKTETYLRVDVLKKDLNSAIQAIRQDRLDNFGLRALDIPERILTRQEYDNLIKRNQTLVDNFSTTQSNRERAFMQSMNALNDNLESYANEAISLFDSTKGLEVTVTEKKNEVDSLESEIEALNKKYAEFGATEQEIQDYEDLYDRYKAAFEDYNNSAQEYQSRIDALNEKNTQITETSERMQSEQEVYQTQAERDLLDVRVQSYEMNRLISQYTDEVLKETWTWYGVAGKSVVNGIENVLAGALDVAALGAAGYLRMKENQYADTARSLGMNGLADFIQDGVDAVEEFTFGEAIDYEDDGWLDSITTRSSEAGEWIRGLSEIAGPTTQEAIDNIKESSIIGGGAIGALESLPAMLSGGAAPLLFFSMSVDSSLEQMSDPRYDGMSDSNKLLVAVATGAAEAALERLGMPKSLRNSPIFSNAVTRALKESGGDASVFRRVVSNQLRNSFKDVALGTAEEAMTGGLQFVSGFAIQEVSDAVNQENFFENPESVEAFIQEVGKNAIMEGIGGFMFSGVGEIAKGRGKNVTDAIFEPLVSAIATGGSSFSASYEQNLRLQLESKKITQEQFDASMADLQMLSNAVNQLPRTEDGGIAANKVQIRALVELHTQKAMMEGQASEASQKKLASINESIEAIESEAQRTYNILSAQEETSSRVEVDMEADGDVNLENLTEQENTYLNEVIKELKGREGGATNVVIHLNQKSASEAGVGESVGGQWQKDSNTVHVNLKAIERNKIEEAKVGFSKLKAFNETIREELNHSLMSADFMSIPMEAVNDIRESWVKAIRGDKALMNRVSSKEAVYRQELLLSSEEGRAYLSERTQEGEVTEKELDDIEASMSQEKKEAIQRELADEVVQEIASFSHTGRIEPDALNRAVEKIGNLMPTVNKNGMWSKMGVKPSTTRRRRAMTMDDTIAAMKKAGNYDTIRDQINKRNSRGINPAALPDNKEFTIRIKYPGITTRPTYQRYQVDKKFNGKWDFVNHIRRLTKDGSEPFYRFELVENGKVKEINGYAIAGWNFRNSYKPVTSTEATIALNEIRDQVVEQIKEELPFDEREFYQMNLEAPKWIKSSLAFSSFLRQYAEFDLLVNAGLLDPVMPFERRYKGRLIGEQKEHNDATILARAMALNSENIRSIYQSLKPSEIMELVDLARMAYPKKGDEEKVAEAFIRSSSSLAGKPRILTYGKLANLLSALPQEAKNEILSSSIYGEETGPIHPAEALGIIVTKTLGGKDNASTGEITQMVSDIVGFVDELAEKNGSNFRPKDQFKLHAEARTTLLNDIESQNNPALPKNIQSFSPVLDLIIAVTSNGTEESVNTKIAKDLFLTAMSNYKNNGVFITRDLIKTFKKQYGITFFSKKDREEIMVRQLLELNGILFSYIKEDGSLATKEFVDWAKGKTERTKSDENLSVAEVKKGFRNLHFILSGGASTSYEKSSGHKISNYALALMGVDDVVPVDAHVQRYIMALRGDWKEKSLYQNVVANGVTKELRSKLTGTIYNVIYKMKEAGNSVDEIVAAFEDRGIPSIPMMTEGEVKIKNDGKIVFVNVSDVARSISKDGKKFSVGNLFSVPNKSYDKSTELYWHNTARQLSMDVNGRLPGSTAIGKIIENSMSSLSFKGEAPNSDSVIEIENILKEALQKIKEGGKNDMTLAGLGQYLFVFGKLNDMKQSRKEVFDYTPLSASTSADVDVSHATAITERLGEAKGLDLPFSTEALNNFSISATVMHKPKVPVEAYPTFTTVYAEDGDTMTVVSSGVESKLEDRNEIQGTLMYPIILNSGEQGFTDEFGRILASNESIVSINKANGDVIHLAREGYDLNLNPFDTSLAKADFNKMVKSGEIPAKDKSAIVKAFKAVLDSGGFNWSGSEKDLERLFANSPKEIRDNVINSFEDINKGVARNSMRLRNVAARKAAANEFSSVKQQIISNPENYISKQNIKEAKDRIASMTNDELMAIMTDDALGRLSNRNDDMGVLAASELIQRKVDRGDMEAVPNLIEELAKMGTTAGRLLRHFREMKRATPEGLFGIINGMVQRRGNKLNESQSTRLKRLTEDLMANQNRLKALIEKSIRGEDVERQLEIARKDLERVERELDSFVNTIVEKGWGQIGVAIMQGNLLTPMSQFTNIGANLVNALIKVPVDMLAMPVANIAEKLGLNIDRKHRLSFAAYAYGLRRFGAGFVEAADQIITGKEEAGTEWRVNRGFMPIRSFMAAWSKKDLPLDATGNVSASQRAKLFVQGTLGIPAEVMFRFLSLGDTPFRRMVEGFELYQMGINKGLEGEELKRFLKYPTKEEQEYAEREGRKLTFQEETTASKAAEDAVSFFERLFARGFDWMPGVDGRAFAKFFVRSNMPYVRTPANILYDTLTFVTPYVAVPRILGSIAKGDSRGASENLAKLIIGTTIMQTTGKLVTLGLISGAVEWDEDEEKNIAYDQFPPSSINVSALKRWVETGDSSKQEDDVFVGYNKLGVLGAIMGATVKSTNKDDLNEDEIFTVNKILRDAFGINAFGSIAYMMDQSFLQGMNSLVNVMSSTDASDFERTFERWYGSMFQAVSSIALPNTLSAYNRADREYLPDTRITKEIPLEERLLKKMSFIIRDRVGDNSKFPIRVDWRGEPIKQNPRGTTGFVYQFFDITKSRQGYADEVSQEIWRLYEETETLSKVVGTPYYATTRKLNVPGLNSRSRKEREAFARTGREYTFLSDPEFGEEKIYLTTEEINKAMELSGRERYGLVKRFMMSDEYTSELTNKERIEELDKINDKFNGFKEVDEDGNFRSHTLYLLDVMEERYQQWLQENE